MEKTTTTKKTAEKPVVKVEAPAEAPVVVKAETKAKVAADKAPAVVKLKSEVEESTAPAPAAKAETIQTDVRAKLARKTDGEDVFVPSTPPQLEAEAKTIAENSGFEFNRGTSVGARLMARSRQQFPQ